MRKSSLLGLSGLLTLAAATGCGEGNAIVTNVRQCGPGTELNEDGTACVADSSSTGGTGGTAPTTTVTTGGLDCGEGTFELQGECVPYDPNDSMPPNTTATPVGGKFFSLPTVELEANDDAVIYYTTDGTDPSTTSPAEPFKVVVTPTDGVPVRFFAIDAAGNEELVKAQTYVVDNDPPAPVTDLTVTPNGPALDVTWTNPSDSDFTGVVLVRQPRQPVAARVPDPGTTFAVADTLDGVEVVYVGNGATFSDVNVSLGETYSYAAFAYDDISNFSTQAGPVQNGLQLLPQTATISIADPDGTPVVTVTTQPGAVNLAGTAVHNAGTLTLDLAITNNTNATLHSPKVVLTATNLGDLTEDGTINSDEYVRIGTGFGLADAGTANQNLVFTAIDTSQDPMIIDVTIAHHETLFMGTAFRSDSIAARFFDTGTNTFTESLGCSPPVFNGNDTKCSLRDPVISIDGQFLYGGASHTADVKQFDLTTGNQVQTLQLGASAGTTQGVVMSLDGTTLYALHGYRCPGGDRGIGGVDLVKIDRATLVESDRLSLHATNSRWNGFGIGISPDGETIVVTTTEVDNSSGSGVKSPMMHLVDEATFTLIDTDSVQGGVQSFDPKLPHSRQPTFLGNSSVYFVQRRVGRSVARVDLSKLHAGEPATVDVLTAASRHVGRIQAGADGNMWSLTDGEIQRHEGATTTSLSLDGGEGTPSGSLVFSKDGTRLWTVGGSSLIEVDAATVTELNSFGHTEQPRHHWMLRSPF